MDFFSIKPSESGFELFGTLHLVIIIVAIGFAILILLTKPKFKESKKEKVVRYTFASVMLLNEFALYAWFILNGETSLAEVLPIEVCGLSLYFGVFMLYTKNYQLFEYGYFWSFGSLLGILFYPLDYSVDRFRFYNYLLNHIFMVLMYLYMLRVHDFIPTLKSYRKSILAILSIVPVVLTLNYFMDANFFLLSNSNGAPIEALNGMNGILYTLFVIFVGIVLFSLGNIHYLFRRRKSS